MNGGRSRAGRVAVVTLGLALAGAVAGTISALAMFLVFALVDGRAGLLRVQPMLLTIAVGGAAVGAVLAPAASLTFMRRVPLGRLFLDTTLAAILAGSVAILAGLDFGVTVTLAAAAFLLAAARLARAFSARRAEPRAAVKR